MKTNLEKLNNLARKLNVEIPAQAVDEAIEKALKEVQQQAHIKGFRPGKAPLPTIKSMYGDRVRQDVIQDLIEKHYYEALKQHSVEPIGYPEFEFDPIADGKDFSFSAAFEVRPEVTLKKYEGLEVQKEKFELDEKKIDEVLENIRASRAQSIPVLEDRPAQDGDIAVVDFDGFVDGKPLEGGKGVDHSLELGSNSFIDGFEQGVIGMKIGDNKTLLLKFPDPYHSKELAGKPVEFKVTLKQEFLKSIGAPSSLDELKKTIREDLVKNEQRRIEKDMKNQILKQLVQANPVDVPAFMLKDQKEALIADMKQKMLDQGMSDTEFMEYAKKWDGDFNQTAAEMIQAGFLVDAIANKHDLHATQADFEKKIEEYAQQSGMELEKIREFYSKKDQSQRLNYMLTEDKVIDFLSGSAKIKEIPAQSKEA